MAGNNYYNITKGPKKTLNKYNIISISTWYWIQLNSSPDSTKIFCLVISGVIEPCIDAYTFSRESEWILHGNCMKNNMK